MTEEAIQPDVSDEVVNAEEDSAEPQQTDARTNAIDAIAEQREAEILAEVGEEPIDNDIEEVIDESDKAAKEPTEPEQEQMVSVKVDGEESQVSISELQAGYQKAATANKRLEQAATERQELERLQAEFAAKQAEAQAPVINEISGGNVSDDDVTKLSNALDDLTVGSEDERKDAVKAFMEVLGRGDNPAIPVEEITQQATQQVRLQMQYDTAQNKFAEDYQDIVSDPTLYQMANNALKRAIPQSQTYEEAFKSAGDTVRQWRDNLTVNNQSTSKLEMKQNLEQEPARVGTRAESQPKPKAETPADIIAAMKTSRGQ